MDEDDLPMDAIDTFHEEQDKIYLDDYKNSQKKKTVEQEFLPLTQGKVWSDESSDEDDGLLTKHQRDLIKLDKLSKFKQSMASDFEDSDEEDEEVDDISNQTDILKPDEKILKDKKSKSKVIESASGSLNWGGKRKQYYGGEEDFDIELDQDEDEMNEYKRLNSLFHSCVNLDDARVQLLFPEPHDLVYAAGASRYHQLIISQTKSQSHQSDSTSSQISPIKTRRDEWEAYLDHSLPVFVRPSPEIENDQNKMREYLKELYPDIHDYYCGSIKVQQWLSKVWEPLYSNYVQLKKISPDSIAGQYIIERKQRLEAEKLGLNVYYRMRHERYAMLRYHSIHNDLKELREERESYKKKDHEFMVLAGNILLKCMHTTLSFREMAKSLPGEEEFLRCFHSLEEDEMFEKANKSKQRSSNQTQAASTLSMRDEEDSDEAMDYYSDDKEDAEERRPITYQMSKNKGLMVKRNKRDRNPRVKLRHKFKKALIRRKSQVPNVRREEERYAGEVFGIRAGLIKSRKFKV